MGTREKKASEDYKRTMNLGDGEITFVEPGVAGDTRRGRGSTIRRRFHGGGRTISRTHQDGDACDTILQVNLS
jgi:hypothetical protein